VIGRDPPPALPERAALLLDVDGTLLDFAPTPESVVVPHDLLAALRVLRARLDNALAMVTGRPVEQVDALFGDLPHAVAGEHGGAIRHAPGEPPRRARLPDVPDAWWRAAETVVAAHDGAYLERKPRGFVFHYRGTPALAPVLEAEARRILAGREEDYRLLPANMAWEIKPRGADKGTAVEALMSAAPFAGRVPVYIGDDVTDEDGMRVARAMGGLGLRVADTFGDAAGVRRWLQGLATA
jgi:trehalose 6-phosphate phosphatase